MSFIRFDEMSFIKFDEIQLITFDEMSSVRFDEKSFSQIWRDRSYQIWWVVFVKFDESLSSSLMNRFVKFLSFRKIELDFVRHLEKIRIEQSKHKRWNDQAWSRERIHKNTFCKKKNLKSHFLITSHISRQNAKTRYEHFHNKSRLSRETFLIFCKKERLSEEKQLIIVMFSKKKKKNFQDN
jgi:hypothetical protein